MPKRLTDEERAFRAVTERQLQTRVIDAARVYGWHVAHFHDSRRPVKPGVFVGDRDAAGFPDLVLCRTGELVFAELKRETGVVTALQQTWLDALEAAGAEVHVVRPSSEAEFVRRVARGRFVQR